MAPETHSAAPVNALDEIVRREIQAHGTLSFSRFMELALYHPEHGYYERLARRIGRSGDFFTSVSVGPLFGELLGFQFAEWTRSLVDAPVQLVEAGAHDGRLALDILNYWREYQPTLFDGAEYWIIEPSLRRQHWQRRTLERHHQKVRWCTALDQLPAAGVRGVIFSNELLDAFPARRFAWNPQQRTWFEWGVRLEQGHLVWGRMDDAAEGPSGCPEPALPTSGMSSNCLDLLPDGFTTEVCPAAATWWLLAARSLRQGVLMTIDYGLSAEEFLAPERAAGTLRVYHRHRAAPNPLERVGEQDLSVSVDFTALQSAGESAGLATQGLALQAQFLTKIVARIQNTTDEFPNWSPSRRRQFHTLTHPEHLGAAFRVLWQTQ